MSKEIPKLDIPLDPFGDLAPGQWPRLIRENGKWATEKQIQEQGFYVPGRLAEKVWGIIEHWAMAERASQRKAGVRQ